MSMGTVGDSLTRNKSVKIGYLNKVVVIVVFVVNNEFVIPVYCCYIIFYSLFCWYCCYKVINTWTCGYCWLLGVAWWTSESRHTAGSCRRDWWELVCAVGWWLPGCSSSADRCPAFGLERTVRVSGGFTAAAGRHPGRMDVVRGPSQSGGDVAGEDESSGRWRLAASRQLAGEERSAAGSQGNDTASFVHRLHTVKYEHKNNTRNNVYCDQSNYFPRINVACEE